MTWRLARSLGVLRNEANQWREDRDKASDGARGDAAHQSRPSDHNEDANGVVRALDLDEDADQEVGRQAWAMLLRTHDPRCKYAIYEGQMLSSYPKGQYPAWTPRPYSGSNPHTQHIHISVVAGDAADDTYPWGLAPQEPPMPTKTYNQAVVGQTPVDLEAGRVLAMHFGWGLVRINDDGSLTSLTHPGDAIVKHAILVGAAQDETQGWLDGFTVVAGEALVLPVAGRDGTARAIAQAVARFPAGGSAVARTGRPW